MGKITGTFEVVPIKGQKLSTPFEVPASATTVGEVAKELGYDLKNRNVMVNGSPATSDTAVKQGDTVALTERPKGS